VSSSGEPTVKTYSDCLGRTVYEEKTGFSGALVVTENKYNNKGQLVQQSEPYFAGGTTRWTNYLYDINSRVDRISTPSSIMSYSYNEKTTAITNLSTNQSTSQTLDASGLLASSTDALGGSVIYKYNSFFKVKSTTPNSLATTMEYDEYGNQTKLTDPDAGVISYEYNALGEQTSQTDARGNTYNNTYDKIGRLLSKTCAGQTTSYIYDNKTKGIGALGSILSPGNINAEYVYDSYSRCQSETQNVDGASYATTYGYSNGKISSLTYPSGFAINYLYNTNGYLNEVKRSDNNTTIWQAEQINALGQIELQMNGNNLRTTKTYDTNHFLTSVVTGTVQNLEYGFDPATGNLTYRKDLKRNLTEDFTYDNLDRLKTATVQGQLPVVLNYASSGNILDKTEIGTYAYQLPQPHAVSKISASNGLIPSVPQTISYNSFNKVSQIIEDTKSARFTYGHDEERRKMEILTGSTVTLTRYYIGLYEREVSPGIIRELHYIPTGDGCTAIYEKLGTGATQMYYIHSDHQGSVQTITNQSGAIVEELSFDAWGRRRNVSNWSYSSVPTTFTFSRGYTGHEHLDQFNLINMNGRLYDPQLGRMLSVDRYVQDPSNTQSYNRYSYCMNNPLKYTDPSGWAGEGGVGTYTPWWAFPARPFGITPADRAFWNNTEMTNEAWINASSPGGSYNSGQVNSGNSHFYKIDYYRNTAYIKDGKSNTTHSELTRSEVIVEYDASGQGGDPSLPGWLTWSNNGVNAAAYGAYEVGGSMRFMKGGSLSLKYYASAWTGGSRASITTFNLSKLGTGFGYGTSFVGAGIGVTNFILSDKQHWSDYGRLGVSLTSATLTCFPATTGVGIGLGVADAAGGLNGFYNYLDANQQLYNSTGSIMIPGFMGIPTLLNLKW